MFSWLWGPPPTDYKYNVSLAPYTNWALRDLLTPGLVLHVHCETQCWATVNRLQLMFKILYNFERHQAYEG